MQIWQIAAVVAACAAVAALGIFAYTRFRSSPEKQERRRRAALARHGRLLDGVITGTTPTAVYYQYAIGGVGYHASQDITHLQHYLPDDAARLVGPVWLKYNVRNPANSIVVCEQWSGFQSLKEKQPR